MFLNNLAERGFSFTVVDHCRTMLKAILKAALDADPLNYSRSLERQMLKRTLRIT
jgi:hypothetical protein